MKISKNAIIHYFLLYLLIVSIGSVKYSEYHDIFIALNLLVFCIYWLCNKRVLRLNKSVISIIVVGGLAFLLCIYSKGSFSAFNALYLLSVLTVAYTAFHYCPKQTYERYVCLVVMLAAISLICFGISVTKFSGFLHLLPLNSQPYMRCISHGGWLFHYMENYKRNPGIYTEPGLYQMVLLTGLFILFFRSSNFTPKKKWTYIIVLTIALITAQSTTGYLGFLLLAMGVMVSKRNVIGSKLKQKILVGMISLFLIAVADLCIEGTNSPFYTNFVDKLFDDNMKFSLSDNTGNARVQCMLADMKIFREHPLGLGYTIYNSIWPSYLAYNIFSEFSSVGLTKSFAIYGFVLTVYILVMYAEGFYRTSQNKIEWLLILLIYLNTILAQPSICFGCFTLLIYTKGKDEWMVIA